MLARLLGSTDLKQLASFVSPAFFDVMPAGSLYTRARSLRSASKDPGAMRHAVTRRQASLDRAGLPIQLEAGRTGSSNEHSLDDRRRGELIVELYFHQLWTDDPVLLDLRHEAFAEGTDGTLRWRPSSWIAEFDPAFLRALRSIYRGFYDGDDAEFRGGLAALDLTGAEDVFRDQFGADVHAVTFRTPHFVSTFHDVFVRCRNAGKRLHPDFLPLGIELAAMYEHLETLKVPVDVARAFTSATKAMAAS
jgi:hypothetical protein